MRRSTVLLAIVLAVLVLASLFAPAPFTRTVQAEKSNACPGLTNAYNSCRAGNPDPSQCNHILEQIVAHGCYYGSSGFGGGSGSGSF
jgi:hypothetical protein